MLINVVDLWLTENGDYTMYLAGVKKKPANTGTWILREKPRPEASIISGVLFGHCHWHQDRLFLVKQTNTL